MGIRAYADVELAQKRLSARAAEWRLSPQYSSGASAAYRWALGCAEHSPVTGAGDAEGVPALPALTAEVDASVVQMEDLTSRPGPRDYSRGVHDALAWVCGHSDHAP
ncbi:hypothetical protein [Streptomyces sp. NBC_01353]|uniref:hypothetical protein n=1 Tax=Streptomyces sp. NBC_01353 TaxID=2903835 RepID=UPI002E36A036|nr:hypothetical protein [Streptomyces sp. NBC_01353]